MTYDITTRKHSSGWEAKSEAVLEELPKGGWRILKLSTSKSGSTLSATASVCIRHDRGGYCSETYKLFADFCKPGIAAQPCARATEKAVLEVHNRALIQMDALIAEATAHYASKTEAA